MIIDTVKAPEVLSGAARQKAYRERGGEKVAKQKYRHDNSKHQTDAAYLRRKFRAFDGEGMTLDDGSHIYTMLASKLDGGQSTDIIDVRGLSTGEIFEYVLNSAMDDAINIIYGGSYDFNMWLRDFTPEQLEGIYTAKTYVWNGYRLMWRRGKSFSIKRIDRDGNQVGNSVTIYDVVSFFQCPFVKACDDYLGSEFIGRQEIVDNKERRSDFGTDELVAVRHYNDLELENLIRLANELRTRLNKVGLRPRRWDGPGAVAAALLARENIKEHMAESPDAVAEAARFAYAGGRFEVIRFGHVKERAYEYDVNSAYPSALRGVPSLANGKWIHHSGPAAEKVYPFALYHIAYQGKNPRIPGALFRRDPNGTICYPLSVTGWYWTPEYETARTYSDRGYASLNVLECWEFRAEPNSPKPFAFIEPLYNKRRALKKAGDGAHVGIKLALNSLYGKLAQQVGAEYRKGVWRKPPFHQIEWAGYTTSWCRARVLSAVMDNLDSVIAFETDAVFTSVELDVPISSQLGDFERVEFADLTYVQSGLYFGESETNISKTRGVDRGNLTRQEVLNKMTLPMAVDRFATVSLTRFIGAGIALMQGFHKWRRWEVVSKNLSLEPTGKRIHVQCPADKYGSGIALGRWHSTICPMLNHSHSSQFPVLWINPDPNMIELEERRNNEPAYD